MNNKYKIFYEQDIQEEIEKKPEDEKNEKKLKLFSEKKYTYPKDKFKDYVMSLHQTIGNQAVAEMFENGDIQAMLYLGQSKDYYEIEADKVAEKIVSQREPKLDKYHQVIADALQSQRIKIAKKRQALMSPKEKYIRNMTGGRPLTDAERAYYEERFNHDFSDVRIHTNAKAVELAESIDAKAFTHGNDIVFGDGQYQPGTTEGKKLIAHELTHTIQQDGGLQQDVVQMKRDENFDITNTEIDFNKLFSYLEETQQFELLNLLENALLCSDVYDDTLDLFLKFINEKKYELPEGSRIHRLTEEELLDKNLDPTMFEHPKSGFFSALYYNDRTEKYILVFRGTEGKKWLKGKKQPEAIKDWKTNTPQGMGRRTEQYTRAMRLAEHLDDIIGKENFTIAGHSLGGGLAAAASIVIQKGGTITFNAAGLHRRTTRKYNKTKKWKSRDLIDNYFVKGELLTGLQRGLQWLVWLFNSLPLAAGGLAIKIKPAHKFKTPIQKHQMSQVIDSIIAENNLLEKMNEYYRMKK